MMSMLLAIPGLAMLIVGAEMLVKGASRMALAAGVTPLVIGLTVVAMGTSAPEMAVSLGATLKGNPDVAMGNVVGSNIFNVLLILGISALITPLLVARQIVRIDAPIFVAVALLSWWMAQDGQLSRREGLILLAGWVGYTLLTVKLGRRDAAGESNPNKSAKRVTLAGTIAAVCLVAVGLGVLVLGARWMVEGSVTLAKLLGVSDLVISLTIVAAGTSLPEVATTLLAAARGQRDIAVGNVMGSNLFNVLGIGGVCAAAAPGGGLSVADGLTSFDLPVMVAAAVACLPVFFTGHRITRWEGALLLGYYAVYVACLILDAMHHPERWMLDVAMLIFILPLTVLVLTATVFRTLRANRRTT
ncbi:MAG: calcium/sodium antiporter [Phycisphaeraceae bacterium]|nr:calcium/sodium antiporter [Phycisphaeraceae bacterium]